MIQTEKLKPEETRKFVDNAFRDGVLKTMGTDVDQILPPVSRFSGGGKRVQKKQTVIEKLKALFEKYFGLLGSEDHIRTDNNDWKYNASEVHKIYKDYCAISQFGWFGMVYYLAISHSFTKEIRWDYTEDTHAILSSNGEKRKTHYVAWLSSAKCLWTDRQP